MGLSDPRHLGVAVKTADGSGRPLAPVIMALLEHLGGLSESALERLQSFRRPAIVNCHGTTVGVVEVVVELEARD